jgi:hypothetical protein
MLSKYAKQLMGTFKEDDQKNEKIKTPILVSKVLDDGTLIETVYQAGTNEIKFAIFHKGEVTYKKRIRINGKTYNPVSPDLDIIAHKVVLLPSKAEEYRDFNQLIKEIRSFIHKYLEVSPFYEQLASYYIPFTWVFDKFKELPYLRALGDYGCGKTRFLHTIGSLCYKPMFVGGASSVSPIFRIIAQFQGTLVLDEADFKQSDTTNEIVKILNQGFSQGAPVLRSEGDGRRFEVKAFPVYGPKIIATREHWKDTALESRCLIERMECKKRNDIPINLTDDFRVEAESIKNKLLMFRFKTFNTKVDYEGLIDHSIEPRLNQIIVPLLSIIDDKKHKKELKKFMKEYNKDLLQERYSSMEAEILTTIIKVREDEEEPTMKDIAATYNKDFTPRYEITPRYIGNVVRKKLKIPTKKISRGFVVTKDASERIEELKSKYGIEKENEHMNIVNEFEEEEERMKNEEKSLIEHAEELFDVKAETIEDE